MFFRGSRHASVADHVITDGRDRETQYKGIRFVPETKAQAMHVVRQGERLDHLAFRYLHDPERFWVICDANRTMWPDELVAEVGRTILVPLEG